MRHCCECMGDILGCFAIPSNCRQSTFFTFNPKRLTHNFISGSYNNNFELVESYNYLAYEVLNDNQDHSNDVLTKEDMIKLGLL